MTERPSWRVVLIVEDNSDGFACRTFAERIGLSVLVDWLPANGVGDIKRRGPKLIQAAQDRLVAGRGCVAVLIDRDRYNPDPAVGPRLREIARICERCEVPLLLAQDCIEGWLRADEGVCKWLRLKIVAQTDNLPTAKDDIAARYYARTKRNYARRIGRIRVAEHADGSAPQHNKSLRKALQELRKSPCGS